MLTAASFAFDPEVLFKIGLAVALGALIGFERELSHRPAGLRTQMLVAMGSTLFAIVVLSFDSVTNLGAIITGIGFLGAGSIIAMRGHIQGITTAATIWIVASIGVGVGTGNYTISIIAAVLVFAILQIKRVEEKFVAGRGKKNGDPFD